MGTTIRVLLADDHPMMRRGVRVVLEQAPDIEIVGEAKDGVEAKQMVAELRPDILLLDLVMPGLQPYEIEEWVRANCPRTVTLILTAHDRDSYLAKALTAGVRGYLTKGEADERLVEAVRHAARGEVLVTGGQLARASRWQEEVGQKWESLTAREREVLGLLAQGKNNQEIAEALCVTEKTVEKHMSHVLDKLRMGSRTEAALWVVKNRLLEVGGREIPTVKSGVFPDDRLPRV